MEKDGQHALCQLHKRDDHSYHVIFREIFISSDLLASCHMFKLCRELSTYYDFVVNVVKDIFDSDITIEPQKANV
jgi:hypothetical protein